MDHGKDIPIYRDSWGEYRRHAKIVAGWIAAAGSLLDNTDISSEALRAADSPLFARLVAFHCAAAGIKMPPDVTKSAQHCLAVNQRFEAWVAQQRGNHRPAPSLSRDDENPPALDATSFRLILECFDKQPLLRTGAAPPSPPPTPDFKRELPKSNSAAFHNVPLGTYLLFDDMHHIRQDVKRLWERYRAREVSFQTAALLTHAAWEAVEKSDHVATNLGAAPSHGHKVGSVYIFLALGETNMRVVKGGSPASQFAALTGRLQASGYQLSEELEAWLMKDVSKMLVNTLGCSDERTLKEQLHPSMSEHMAEFTVLLRLRRMAEHISKQQHPQRFLDLLTIHLSRPPRDQMHLMSMVFAARTILDIHNMDLVVPMAYWEMNVARFSLREQLHKPDASPEVRMLTETYHLLQQWVDTTVFFPGKTIITMNPVLSGLVVSLLAEIKHALLISETGAPSRTPILQRLRKSYTSMSEKGRLDHFHWPAPHLEHRFKLFKRLGDDNEEAFHTRDLCTERVDGLFTKVEEEINIILPFSDQLANLSATLKLV